MRNAMRLRILDWSGRADLNCRGSAVPRALAGSISGIRRRGFRLGRFVAAGMRGMPVTKCMRLRILIGRDGQI